jgi:thioredoxin 1
MIRLIWAQIGSMTAVCEMSDELERIRARKIAEMAEQSRESGRLSQMRKPVELSDSDFKSAIDMNHLVVVDCWAAWCHPCRLIAPVVEELASEYGSVALFAKLNVDENPLTASVYGIQSIPTILVIKDGVEVDRIVGAMPKEQIEAVLKKHL